MSDKIGIITFHRAVNYGAVLQTYALQKTLTKLNIDNAVIDYRCPFITNEYKPFHIKKGKFAKSAVQSVLECRIRSKKRRKFDQFVEKNIKLTKSYDTVEALKECNKNFSAFITGSDQVFSPVCVGFDEAYFLTFADSDKKYSYAASFGTNLLDSKIIPEYKRRLQDFQKISVRENSGKKIISDIVKKDAVVLVDPTLLLKEKDYKEIVGTTSEKDYIVVFNVSGYTELMSYAQKLAKQKNLKLIYINDQYYKKVDIAERKTAVSPEEFLALFKNANYIVTNSFHATVFSIIFNKQFAVDLTVSDGTRNNRVAELLDYLNISDRAIKNCNCNIDNIINWKEIEDRLDIQRKNSYGYLRSIVSK